MASFAAKIFFLKDEFRAKSYYFVPHHPFDVRKKKYLRYRLKSFSGHELPLPYILFEMAPTSS